MSTSVIFTALSIATRFLSISSAYPRIFPIAAAASFCSLAIATPISDSIDSSYDTYGKNNSDMKRKPPALEFNRVRM